MTDHILRKSATGEPGNKGEFAVLDNPILAAFLKAHAAGATATDVRDDLLGYQIGYPGSDTIDEMYDALTAVPEEWDRYSERALEVLAKLAGQTVDGAR